MSLFDYPRFNFSGIITLNPGTANNDDYAQQPSRKIPSNWQPLQFRGQAFGLFDSVNVEARTFGMSEEKFIAWVQKAQQFDPPGSNPIIPAEWNYYGVMNSTAENVKIVGIQIGPGQIQNSGLDDFNLSMTGGITDINSEGSPPATQFFLDNVKLTQGDQTLLGGVPSKGVCQQINVYRNVNLQGDSGSGCYVYHVIRNPESPIPQFNYGVVLRYYLFRVLHPHSSNKELEELYASDKPNKTNPAPLQIVGTIAPLRPDEKILAAPTGRQLTWTQCPNIRTDGHNPNPEQLPTRVNNGGGVVALAPAIVHQKGDAVSVDFIGTFPDYYLENKGSNDKFNFGEVTLQVTDGADTAKVGDVAYQNTAAGDRQGWIYDFDISANPEAEKIRTILANDGTFELVSTAGYGAVLTEAEYMIVSNQQAIYAEQGGPGDMFRNQGTLEPATISVFRRGVELQPGNCPPINVWQYPATPLQDRGIRQHVNGDFAPGQKIEIDTSQPGNLFLCFTIGGAVPPEIYNPPPPPSQEHSFTGPPFRWITNAPQISIRILPNEDFSRYYQQKRIDGERVGNDDLTFEVLYEKVLKTYYLLFPGMNMQGFSLGLANKKQIIAAAPSILCVTEMDKWMTTQYMPRTRDLSQSRRELLRAWCHNPH